MEQNQKPQVSEQRLQELRALIGAEVFVVAYTLAGDGTIEVGKVADVIVDDESKPVPVLLEGRAWRHHHMGIDAFTDLQEAVNVVSAARDQEVKNLRARADSLVAMQFKAPANKVKEAEEKAAAKQAGEQQEVSKAAPKAPRAKTPAKPTAKRVK